MESMESMEKHGLFLFILKLYCLGLVVELQHQDERLQVETLPPPYEDQKSIIIPLHFAKVLPD
jgi:hypothetical protein